MTRALFILFVCTMAVCGRTVGQGDTAEKDSLKEAQLKASAIRAGAKELAKVYEAKDGEEKEKAYLRLVKRFSPEPSGVSDKLFDFAREAVALAFAHENNLPKTIEYISMLTQVSRAGEVSGKAAVVFMTGNHLAEAEPLLNSAVMNAQRMLAAHRNDGNEKMLRNAYVYWCDRYADLLYQEKKYTLALPYAQLAHDSIGGIGAEVNAHYAGILIALGRDQEAFNIIDEAVRAGMATGSMQQQLVTLYPTVKGKEGYEAYMAEVDRQLLSWAKERVFAKMTDEPAPDFTLRDLDGRKVSLADYKGKIVVIDFWATWCGPCKASFPAMQLAVNKYRDDPDVQFLFIHTWEQEGNATKEARKYIGSMNYTFRVLMDLKEGMSGNPVVKSYNVSGIPARFVIDKNGHIRFRLKGFRQSQEEEAVADLSAMIVLAQKL